MKGGILFICCLLFVGTAVSQERFQRGVLVLRVNEMHRNECHSDAIDLIEIRDVFERIKVTRIEKKFPNQSQNNEARLASNQTVDLSLIYNVYYNAELSPIKASNWLEATGSLFYAEPAYIMQPLGVPNDALLHKQWHLSAIKAFEAWDLSQGSSGKTVAIIDTGVDWDHPDLVDAIELNLEDPIDGLDNDENGYIDDHRGWNFYDNNNDPDELSWSHGTHVAGLSGASTNNNTGVAGSGYKCKILAIKAGNQLELTHGYEGIEYAVMMGADVINCSWGSTDYTQLGHDVVKFATEMGKLVVCGGGNNNNDYDFYPAAFPEAMAVSATDSLTNKATFSSFYYAMDIAAPGQVVFSTKNGTYDYDNGTSMSSPIVAGAAAIVLDRFGYMPPAQLKAQLMETATNIDSLNLNSQYANRLGSGLLNMRAALDTMVTTSIGMENYEITDGDDEVYVVGDLVDLGIELVNYFEQTGPIAVKLSMLNDLATLLDSIKTFPALGENGRANNMNDPFQFEISDINEYNETIDLRVDITSGGYHRVEHIRMLVNPDFVNVAVNDVSTTLSSSGHVGYANNSRTAGLGMQLENEGNFLFEAGLLIGSEAYGYTKVADRVRGEQYTDRDFWPVSVIEKIPATNGEAFLASGRFNDTSAIEDEIGLIVNQKTWAYDDQGHRNYVVIEYTVVNVGERDLKDLNVGIYADWDVRNAAENRGETSYGKRLGFVYSSSDVPYAGGIVQLNFDKPFYSYMINNAGDNGKVNLRENGFSSEEKWYAMTHNQLSIGQSDLGVDVSQVISMGSTVLASGDSATVAFAFIATKNKEEMLAQADSAFKRHNGFLPGDEILTPFQSVKISPNPTSNDLRVEFALQKPTSLNIDLYGIDGTLIHQFGEMSYYAGPNFQVLQLPSLTSGSYFLRIYGGDINRTIPMNYLHD
jgi:serine protease